MFPAELTVVYSNLLTNAVKAAGEDGEIVARGYSRDGKQTVVIENTGIAVDLEEAERWFRPFESTTAEVDSTLGRGMGLGLTITRDILEQYGASIRFTAPSEGFATAVEIQFSDLKENS
jgi:signal transduction histidine kinase